MTTRASDRRRAPRAPVTMTVSYETTVESGQTQTLDVSETGLFLGTPNPLPVGTVLRVNLDETNLRVQVRRVVEGGAAPGRQSGMGVVILDADEQLRRVLRSKLGRRASATASVRVDGPWPEPFRTDLPGAGDGDNAALGNGADDPPNGADVPNGNGGRRGKGKRKGRRQNGDG